MFMDCTYEGDLMAAAGVSYIVRRESNCRYGETLNGAQVRDKHQFTFPVDPYREEGNPASGLLPGIESGDPVPGAGDRRVQEVPYADLKAVLLAAGQILALPPPVRDTQNGE